MTDWIIVLILLGEVLLLARLDRMTYGTWLTPVTLLGVPYALVMLVAFLFGPALGFIPLNAESILVWAAGLLVFWLGGLAIGLALGKAVRVRAALGGPALYEEESGRLALLLAWLSIPVIVVHFLTSLRHVGGLPGLGTEGFEDAYGGGFGAHLLTICTVLFIFLVGTSQKGRKAVILTIAVMAALILIRQVKYSVILPLWAGLVYRIATGRTRLTVKSVGAFLFTVYAIFNSAYLIGFWALDPESIYRASTYGWLLRHFAAYVLAGVLPLGELVRGGLDSVHGDPRITFSPLVNLFAFATSGELVAAGNEYATIITRDGLTESNVSTLFGPLLIGLGYWGALVYTMALGLVSYTAFAVAMLTRNCWVLVMWLFIASLLAFGWYCSFFELLISIEAPVYCLLLACLMWLARGGLGQAGPAAEAAALP